MQSQGQRGMEVYILPALPVIPNPSPEQLKSRLLSASLQSSLHQLKLYNSIGADHLRQEEVKALHARISKEYGYHQWWAPGAM